MRFWGKRYKDKTRIAHRDKKGTIVLFEFGSMYEFDRFRQEINKSSIIFIACIAFARNLIEYSVGENEDYLTLTSGLHLMHKTDTLQGQELSKSIASCLKNVDVDKYKGRLYLNILEQAVGEIEKDPSSLKLEHKIVIAIAIRLSAERYIYNKISSVDNTYSLEALDTVREQTAHLFEEYISRFGEDDAYIILNQVMLMTPESIHINSFMYEPLLDMSLKSLLTLKNNVAGLTVSNSPADQ